MRVIDAVVRSEWFGDLKTRAEEEGHRVVVLAEGERIVARITCDGGDTDDFLEALRDRLRESCDEDEHYTVFEPVALEPRPDEDEPDDQDEPVAGTDEIESFVEDGARMSRTFLVLSLLAGVIAGAALLRNSTAALVGSMVLAPLAKPIALIGVAIVLGHPAKALRAGLALVVSLGIAAAAATLITLVTPSVPITHLVEGRTGTSPFDLVVALAAGLAMAYVLLKRDAMSMVGIVVAASLMPVAAALGVVAATGRFDLVLGACFTLLSNISGIVLGLIVGLRVEELRNTDRRRELLASKLTTRSIIVGGVVILSLAGIGIWSTVRAHRSKDLSVRIVEALEAIQGPAITRGENGSYLVFVPESDLDDAVRALQGVAGAKDSAILVAGARGVRPAVPERREVE